MRSGAAVKCCHTSLIYECHTNTAGRGRPGRGEIDMRHPGLSPHMKYTLTISTVFLLFACTNLELVIIVDMMLLHLYALALEF